MIKAQQESGKESLRRLVDTSVNRSVGYLLGQQHEDGYWWGRLESNATMEAEYLMMSHFMGVQNRDKWPKLANYILQQQRQDGSWGQYYGAPGDLNTSVECYFALKLAGIAADEPSMQRAKAFILSKGGLPNIRVFTKIWLALFGQWSWDGVPTMAPEMSLLPSWFPLNIYNFSSWARATVVPILVLTSKKPVVPVPPSATLDDLFPPAQSKGQFSVKRPKNMASWRGLFWFVDQALKLYNALPWQPGRNHAIRKSKEWILQHQEEDGSWGGIQPPWVYSLMALKTLGYTLDHPVLAKGFEGFQTFAVEDDTTLSVQACISPVWDTCLTMMALEDAGIEGDHPGLQRATRWLLSKEVRRHGDWSVRGGKVEPSGWAFEFANTWYPDVDDTAGVVIALSRARLGHQEELGKKEAIDRALAWLLHMQSKNGGWASFDKDNVQGVVAKIPFSDFGETVDPPSVDVTAHVLEALGRVGGPADGKAVAKALAYVWGEQEPDGPWFGRWGVNYIYGSGAVLPALEALGHGMDDARVQQAVKWIVAHQNKDGGWGESCASYADPAWRGRGPSTASQTAWALLALLAAGQGSHPAVQQGIYYLAETQNADGSWDEPWFTGTGFPGYGIGRRLERWPRPGEQGYQGIDLSAGFMIKYHMYRNYWPLMALGRYKRYSDRAIEPNK